jgi:glycosyltransferase involved in cell wall biosynthesis
LSHNDHFVGGKHDMHICIDARVTDGGQRHGIARVVRNLLGELVRDGRGLRYTVLVGDDSLDRVLDGSPHIRIHRAPVDPYGPATLWRIPAVLREVAPDLYHCTTYVAPPWPPCPMVVSIYDLIQVHYPRDYGLEHRIYYRTAARIMVRRAKGVLTCSKASAVDLKRILGVPPAKITVQRLALEANFGPSEDPAGHVHERLGLKPPFVLSLVNSRPHKNAVGLVRAYASLHQRNDLPPLVLVGIEPDQISQAAAALRQAQVCCFTQVGDGVLADLYATASLFVLPSFCEGFGLPALEAMHCGTPVACSNIAPLAEVVGPAALTFDPHDERQMAEAIRRPLADPALAQRMREAGLKRAAGFSLSAMADQTIDVYRRLARRCR